MTDLDEVDRVAGKLPEDIADLIWYLSERTRAAERLADAARTLVVGDTPKHQQFAELCHGYDEWHRRAELTESGWARVPVEDLERMRKVIERARQHECIDSFPLAQAVDAYDQATGP